MQCPKCKTPELRATRIEDDLPAAGCPTCHGTLVSLLYYRDWAERHANDSPEIAVNTSAVGDTADTSTAIMCPKCGRLMSKYKISGCVSNRLDVCSGCDEAWLDGGEWELLKVLELSRNMPKVFTEQWQRGIRRQVAEDNRRNALRKLIGNDGVMEVERFKIWLDSSDHRSEILVYLYAEQA
jgi:Zn-finger nucleic acid-binding protein